MKMKEEDKRKRIIRVRVNDIEFAQLQEKAGAVRISPFLRTLGLGYQPRKKPTPKADPALIRELARLGNNLNQLTKTANQMRAQGQHLDALRLLSALHDIEDELEQIRDHHSSAQAVEEVDYVG